MSFEHGLAKLLADARSKGQTPPIVPKVPTDSHPEGQSVGRIGTLGGDQGRKPAETDDPAVDVGDRAAHICRNHAPAVNADDGRINHRIDEAVSWSVVDWQTFYDERAGIAEFDGGLSRNEAEARALACCIVEWMRRAPVISDPSHCVYCDGVDEAGDQLLPFVAMAADHMWLHSKCWEAWFRDRQGDAVAALAEMGIGPFTTALPTLGAEFPPHRQCLLAIMNM